MLSLGRQASRCGYCKSEGETFIADYGCPLSGLDGATYEDMLNEGWRRSGMVVYRPVSGKTCCSLVPIRISVARFEASRSQRKAQSRVERAFADIRIVTKPAAFRRDAFELFARYQSAVHSEPDWTPKRYAEFLVDSPLASTAHQHYYSGSGSLLAVGVVDATPNYLSSVYFFYDPLQEHVSLGTYGVLREVEYAAATSKPCYTLGYYSGQCAGLSYKARFGPAELLLDGQWSASPDDRPRQ